VLNFDAVLLSECLLVLTYPSYGLLKLAGLGQILISSNKKTTGAKPDAAKDYNRTVSLAKL